jgi:putative hydrolase of the HAD superfamily
MKPDSQYFLRVIRKLELPAEQVALLDDHDVNVAAASEVGLHAAQYQGEAGVGALWLALAELGIG